VENLKIFMFLSIFSKVRLYFLFFVIVLFSLWACDLFPYAQWDDYDPKLHGQTVHFKEPMKYVLLETKHIGDYLKEDVEIGRILTTEESVFNPGGYDGRGHVSESIKDGMAFRIKTSYWQKENSFNRQFVGDRRALVMVGEDGIESIMSFYELLYSDRAELFNFKDEGRFK
jgi:hypothetical protein